MSMEHEAPMTDDAAATETAGDVALPLEAADIMRIIPHRYPFLLIDRVVELEPGKRVVAMKSVTANEPQFTAALKARQELDKDADNVPKTYRAGERAYLNAATSQIKSQEQAAKGENFSRASMALPHASSTFGMSPGA